METSLLDELTAGAAPSESSQSDPAAAPTKLIQRQGSAHYIGEIPSEELTPRGTRPIKKEDRSAAREYFYMTITAINMMQLEDGLEMCTKQTEKELWGDAC